VTAVAIIRRSPPVETLARESGLHPDLVRALIHAGWVGRDEAPARLARAMRLRRDLGVNLAGALLACDLLARIDELEARLRRYER
jgi:MerR HTH family regulatory protein